MLGLARKKSADEIAELIDINQTIQNALVLVESFLFRGRIHLELNLADDLPLAYGIAGQLEDVWLNLILNARDAIIEQKNPLIGISSVHVPEVQSVQVVIWDNGPGFKEVSLDHLFDAFYTTKPPGEGTGLGLYICKLIVDRCGGSIKIDKTYSHGAKFIISLPYMPTDQMEVEHVERSIHPAS
ncbi:MAG: HAMP domain-containing histidine kinase [Anaerolineae bacterium]|nr:HAMP domain-containing histidine kinase [Anaerolineae bacterium]